MKSCDVCGTLNLKENSYCTHCGSKFVIEHICPYCGYVNQDYATHCLKCEKQINPVTIDDFDILFSEYNENLLLNAKITDGEYAEILSNIFKRAKIVGFYGNTVRNKILNFASIFTQCKPKSRGYERGFIFLDNCIYYDDRLEDSVQIATIIHELAHYFLYEIIENLLCYIFQVRPSPTLQSFIWYFLTLPEFKIMNEYCAHTVEGRFIPHGYQNYGSFNVLVENADIDSQSLDAMIAVGNSFANEIIVYLEKYIDEGLRQDIKLQYAKDLTNPNYNSIFMETDISLDLSVKNSVIISVLGDILKEASSPDTRKELGKIREEII